MKKLQLANMVLFFSLILIYSCEKSINQVPTCSFINPETLDAIEQGQTVNISVSAEDTDGSITNVTLYVDGFAVGATSRFPYNFEWNTSGEEPGSHRLRAIVRDNEGGIATAQTNVEIIGIPPRAAFLANRLNVITGALIQFSDESTNDPTSWEWDFGDGGTSNLQNPTYTYFSAGNYTVTLTSTNSYGSDSESKANYITVTSSSAAVLTDSRDGKTYQTVQIGDQIWMAENLNYETETGSWVYNNNSRYAEIFGRLYTWEVALDVCPGGWHLPSDEEWKQMEMAVGMCQDEADKTGRRGTTEGYKLKATSGWDRDGNGTNEYGFAALPGGKVFEESFSGKGTAALFWSSTESSQYNAWSRYFDSIFDQISRGGGIKWYGYSVRCVKDK